jgi:hypothetical protein
MPQKTTEQGVGQSDTGHQQHAEQVGSKNREIVVKKTFGISLRLFVLVCTADGSF